MKDDEVYPYQKKGLTLENNFEEIEKMFADEAAEIGKWEEKKFKRHPRNQARRDGRHLPNSPNSNLNQFFPDD